MVEFTLQHTKCNKKSYKQSATAWGLGPSRELHSTRLQSWEGSVCTRQRNKAALFPPPPPRRTSVTGPNGCAMRAWGVGGEGRGGGRGGCARTGAQRDLRLDDGHQPVLLQRMLGPASAPPAMALYGHRSSPVVVTMRRCRR